MTQIPRGKYRGKRDGAEPKDKAQHFMRCPVCGGMIDMRDLGQVFEHEGHCRIRHDIASNDGGTPFLVK